MLTITTSQQKILQDASTLRFYRSLFSYITTSFPEYDNLSAKRLFQLCMAFAASEGITTEYGITSLAVVSFMFGECIANDVDFREFHAKCVALTGDKEMAITAFYEGMY